MDYRTKIQNLADALVEDINSMSDEEILREAKEDVVSGGASGTGMSLEQAMPTDYEYLHTDPFSSDESTLECRTVEMRVARKEHDCYGLEGRMDHKIRRGDRYRYERALVDGSFWGEYRLCLSCMDKFIAGCF